MGQQLCHCQEEIDETGVVVVVVANEFVFDAVVFALFVVVVVVVVEV